MLAPSPASILNHKTRIRQIPPEFNQHMNRSNEDSVGFPCPFKIPCNVSSITRDWMMIVSSFKFFNDLMARPKEIRTPDPQIRSLVLYPAELRARNPAAVPSFLGRLGRGRRGIAIGSWRRWQVCRLGLAVLATTHSRGGRGAHSSDASRHLAATAPFSQFTQRRGGPRVPPRAHRRRRGFRTARNSSGTCRRGRARCRRTRPCSATSCADRAGAARRLQLRRHGEAEIRIGAKVRVAQRAFERRGEQRARHLDRHAAADAVTAAGPAGVNEPTIDAVRADEFAQQVAIDRRVARQERGTEAG